MSDIYDDCDSFITFTLVNRQQ